MSINNKEMGQSVGDELIENSISPLPPAACLPMWDLIGRLCHGCWASEFLIIPPLPNLLFTTFNV